MNPLTIKQNIAQALNSFSTGNLADNAQNLFQTLGYQTDRAMRLVSPTPDSFLSQFTQDKPFNAKTARLSEWQFVDIVFQLTKDEIRGGGANLSSFNTNQVDNTIIESYLFFAVALTNNSYSRTALATITRELNKLFAMPVMVVFQHGQTLSLSIINRRLHKRDEFKDVLEKVTLIKDIDYSNPHRAHQEILFDLSLSQLYKNHKFTNFVELHRAWQKTLDSTELNKQFFQEVSDWYFWAREKVRFPEDAPKDEEGLDSASLIRLITRLIFVWFLKEKRANATSLVPEEFFQEAVLKELMQFDDPNATTYYKAILQNLFFATLNQEMNTAAKSDNRKFRGKSKSGGRDAHYMTHNVYRYEVLFKEPQRALELFEGVPFLNGGLFECLDREDGDDSKKILRVDGFSDRPDNPLSVPNYLFFSEEQTVDLSEVYGSKKKKKCKVRGLINIFNRYKFTIAENTPLEEEVALDPELLGRVFENLLAAYNPETKVTARKQTGSFYTPREVVDYMANESLLAYFQEKVKPKSVKEEDFQGKLRRLLDYQTPENPFADDGPTTESLIEAIDNLKVLDPAVGSGAFPMGMLQKLTFVLGKLDPNNDRWKQQQKEREISPVLADLQRAQQISYEQAREAAIAQLQERLAEIEADFAENEMDYPRKLFLIENCIYGVDVQAIAVQIAKLRFFISLIVEQRADDTAPNRGILPLPNLETKFVAANTLVRLDREDQFGQTQLAIRDLKIERLETELKIIRHKCFAPRTSKTKAKYRDRDRQLREELVELLKAEGLSGETATKLAQWDPYDQNTAASFFDPEWMFGVGDGFDICIGNPPYVRIQNVDKKLVEYFKKAYKTAFKSYDLCILFIEKAVNDLVRSDGFVCFISSKKFVNSDYGEKIKEMIYREKLLDFYIDMNDAKVFDSVIAYTGIFMFSKTQKDFFYYVKIESDRVDFLKNISDIKLEKTQYSQIAEKTWLLGSNDLQLVFDKIKKFPLLSDFSEIFVGLQTNADPVYVLEIQNNYLYSKYTKKSYQFNYDIVKPLLKGAEIKRYSIPTEKYKLIFPYRVNNNGVKLLSKEDLSSEYPLIWDYLLECAKKLKSRENGKMNIPEWWGYVYPKNLNRFSQPKIITQVLANHSSLTLDIDRQYYFVGGGTAGGYGIVLKDDSQITYQYLLGLLNSTILEKYLQSYASPFKGGFFAYNKTSMGKLPIPTGTETERQAIATLVNYILYLTAELKDTPNSGEQLMAVADDKLMLNYFEQIVDALVLELYLPEDLHQHDKQFIDHLSQEDLPKIDSIKGNKLEALREIFQKLFNKKHPIRENLFFLDSVPVVRTIRGLK